MTHEITLKLQDPRATLRLLRGMIPVNADEVSPGERPAIEALCAQIEEQVKPAIEEPTEWGSIVRATEPHGRRRLWQIDERSGKHYWQANDGTVEVWSELTDVEVLRVGLGDLDKEREQIWTEGARELAAEIHHSLQNLLDEAITSERKNAFEKAIQAVEELAP